jgi:4-carboxymuconolactone decarboxylase
MLKETRAGLGGPWNVVLRSPEVGKGIIDLYGYYRNRTPLPQRLVEFGILVTAREWSSQYEWFIHYPLALKQGVAPEVLAALRVDKRPIGMKEDEGIAYDFATELFRRHVVSATTFVRAKTQFGEKGVVDLTTLVGTYVSIAAVLNVGEVRGAAKDGPAFLPVEIR